MAAEEALPIPTIDDTFDRVVSIGVIHFWVDTAASLAEVHRIVRPGGRMLMGCLAPVDPPDFARPEYGLHLRDTVAWDKLYCNAGFATVDVEQLQTEQITPDGAPTKRHSSIRVTAQA